MSIDTNIANNREGGVRLSDAWIFISHSHLDLDAVRRVRDEFERLHANPLLFFLRCVADDGELDSLIKREIAARNIFLLCDSPSAQKSSWVKKEREFLLSLNDRKIHELNLDWPWEKQRRVIHETLESATVYINCTWKDRDRIQTYVDLLADSDFAVYDPGSGPRDRLARKSAMERSLAGYFFAFISLDYLDSRHAKEFEVIFARPTSLK